MCAQADGGGVCGVQLRQGSAEWARELEDNILWASKSNLGPKKEKRKKRKVHTVKRFAPPGPTPSMQSWVGTEVHKDFFLDGGSRAVFRGTVCEVPHAVRAAYGVRVAVTHVSDGFSHPASTVARQGLEMLRGSETTDAMD